MTSTTSNNTGNFWDFNSFVPQPKQDSELLQQLSFLPGLKEILMLRQVHALEHATVWVLSEIGSTANQSQADNETIGGLSTERGFYLYGQLDRSILQRSVHTALQRLQGGEWNLAIHPRCGTNLSVAIFLTAGLALTSHLLLPRNPFGQLIGLGLATTTAAQIAPDLGMSVQKYLTTSIPFNLTVKEITETTDLWGRSAHFVSLEWQNLQ